MDGSPSMGACHSCEKLLCIASEAEEPCRATLGRGAAGREARKPQSSHPSTLRQRRPRASAREGARRPVGKSWACGIRASSRGRASRHMTRGREHAEPCGGQGRAGRAHTLWSAGRAASAHGSVPQTRKPSRSARRARCEARCEARRSRLAPRAAPDRPADAALAAAASWTDAPAASASEGACAGTRRKAVARSSPRPPPPLPARPSLSHPPGHQDNDRGSPESTSTNVDPCCAAAQRRSGPSSTSPLPPTPAGDGDGQHMGIPWPRT